MKKTGQQLQELRNQRGITLQEVSSILKINVKTLQAIEAGDSSQLPKAAFVRGFIKSYAMYLKGDVDLIIKEYLREIGEGPKIVASTPEESPAAEGSSVWEVTTKDSASKDSASNQITADALQPTQSIPPADPKKQKAIKEKPDASLHLLKNIEVSPSTQKGSSLLSSGDEKKEFSYSDFDSEQKQKGGWKIAIFVLLIVVLSSVILVSIRTIERYQKESKISVETEKDLEIISQKALELPVPSKPVAESSSDQADESESSSAPLSTQSDDADETENASEVAPAPQPAAATPPITSMPAPASVPEAARQATPPAAVASEAAAQPTTANADAPTPAPPAPPQKFREVIVEAFDDVSIVFESNGKKETLSLKANQVHTFRSTAGMTFRVSDGGAANFNVNGTDRGLGGEKGSAVVLRY